MAATNTWNSGVYSCFEECGLCCYGFWCTPCLYADNVSRHRANGAWCGPCLLYMCCPFCTCCFAGSFRTEVRGKYNLPEEPCSDCMLHWCCSNCGVCQEAKELNLRLK